MAKYIDDAIIMEKLDTSSFPLLDDQGKKIKTIRAPRSEQVFDRSARRATGRGMKVNQKKTTVLCISDAISFRPEVRLDVGDGEVVSSPTLKVLGFTFSDTPSVNAHAELLVKRLRTRTWALSQLR